MRLASVISGGIVALSSRATAQSDFVSEVEDILARPAFSDASIGVQVRDLESGDIIFTSNEDQPLLPASNQKLLTSTVALSQLGLDFTYETTVLATSEIGQDGVLDGDLWLVGSGDPSLTSARLGDLAQDVVDATGLREVTGRVHGDGTIFDRMFLGEDWSPEDEPFYYSAQVAGLNCDVNVVNVTVAPGPGGAGDAPRISINGVPAADEEYVEIESTVETTPSGGGESVAFDRRRGQNVIILSGSIPADSDPVALRVTIDDPIAFTAYRFAVALREAGVTVSTSPTGSTETVPGDATGIASSVSDDLAGILEQFNKPSDNVYGEALIKTVGRDADPSAPGSATTGAGAYRDFLGGIGVNTTGVHTADGSGLSRLNTLTAQFLCDLLSSNRDTFSEEEWGAFYDSLPVGGVDGTLSGRFVGTPAEGKVHAKTGSLTGVSALSGYLTAGDGGEYVFSILMNELEGSAEARQAQDDIVNALYQI